MFKSPKAEQAEPVVYVIDDDPSMRSALDSLFRSVGHKVQTFETAQDFTNGAVESLCGCLVLDVRLPGLSGLDFQTRLADFGITLPVILMTGHGDIPMSVQGMKAGAVDFLPKPFRDQDMLDAVTTALEKDRAERAQREASADLLVRHESLSAREREVMSHVVKGLMNKQIAFELGLSEITVKIHRGAAMKKMQAKTLADLVKMSERLKLTLDLNQEL
jgi:FixJ family two-component response regulator